MSGVNRQVITNVLNGSVWPDSLTVMDLEEALHCQLWPAQDGSSGAKNDDAGWGTPADERVLDRFVLEPEVLQRMNAEYAAILYWHIVRLHIAAVGDILRDFATLAQDEPRTAATGKGLTLGEIASMDQEEWLAHHSSACATAIGELSR